MHTDPCHGYLFLVTTTTDTAPAARLWVVEFGNCPAGRATAYAVNARRDDIAAGRAARVEWTNADGERIRTQAFIASYAREFAAELVANNTRGQYLDVQVVTYPATTA